MVLQPQNHVAELKQYLAGHHFMIMQEDMAMEDRRLYEMILVKPGAMKGISLLEGEIGVTENYRQHPFFMNTCAGLSGNGISLFRAWQKIRTMRETAGEEKKHWKKRKDWRRSYEYQGTGFDKSYG